MSESHRQSKQYWRSLERLYDSPAFQADGGDEFPEGASRPPSEVDRRTVMKLMGASMAMAGMAACRRPEEHIVPYVSPPEHIVPGVPLHYATTLALGANTAGVVVESHEGRPTKIEGNERHPESTGGADSWTQAAILNLYDPDRSRRPRRRDGGGLYQDTSWSEFETALSEQAADWQADGGQGLALLAEETASPTVVRLVNELRSRYPAMRWVSYEAVSDRNLFDGFAQAAGRAVRPRWRTDRADVILALDADLLGTESGSVAATRGFADRRRPTSSSDAMPRLYSIESRLSLTGANADHRWAVPSRTIPAAVAALAAELGADVSGASDDGLAEPLASDLAAIAADLTSAGSRALIIAGRQHPPEIHAAVYALNHALGSVGTTVELRPLQDLLYSDLDEMRALADSMRTGEVTSLLVLGGNPAYATPADLGLAEAIEAVPFSAHLSHSADETSARVHWQLPASHELEAWHDARAADGTPSVGQPLIAPLFDSRSPIEVLALLAGRDPVDAYEEVRSTWSAILTAGDFDQQWNQGLHDGVMGPPSAELAAAPPDAVGLSATGSGEGVELVLYPSPSVYDGRFANNGWLQELPDPITKITWDNALQMSPADADREGLTSGDVVTVAVGDARLEVPVWVSPGQAAGSVALEIGYGRSQAGVVGNGIGVNAFQLPAATLTEGVTLSATGRRHQLVQTQEHWSMEGRSLVRSASLAEYRDDPDFATRPDEFTVDPLWAEHDYTSGNQWGMTIDLSACTGCSACIVACQSENNIPVVGKEQVDRGREMHWLRIDRYYEGADSANPRVVFQPIPCMHCENAPCEQVCPVAATVHDDEGINVMVYNRCIGTRYCSNNCPYKVRRFNFFNFTRQTPTTMQLAHNPDVTVRSRGVMEKCSFCLQRISEARIRAGSEGRPIADGDIQTACQQTCPADAIVFGDINDPASRVSQLKAANRNYQLLAELYNKPRTSFLARVTNPNPALVGADGEGG